MASREEIREGIANILKSVRATDVPPEKWTLNILEFLDSQGVVRQVDRKLPFGLTSRIPLLKEILDELGYVAVVPLIEEAK